MTPQTKTLLAAAAVCVGGGALLLHPGGLLLFSAGVWAGHRGKDWLKQILHDREVHL